MSSNLNSAPPAPVQPQQTLQGYFGNVYNRRQDGLVPPPPPPLPPGPPRGGSKYFPKYPNLPNPQALLGNEPRVAKRYIIHKIRFFLKRDFTEQDHPSIVLGLVKTDRVPEIVFSGTRKQPKNGFFKV